MAFVSRSERKLQYEDNSSVGPGAYLNQNEYKLVSSFAPFSSTSERDINKIFCKGFTPGPGSYIQNHSNLVSGEANQSKYSSAFASQINRFKPNQFDEVPGPGSYTVPDAWMQQKKKGQIEKITDWTGPFTAPSIPSSRQNNGYEVTDTGALLMNKPVGDYYAGTKIDSVGPGHYYVIEARNNSGPKWHKARNSRNLYNYPTTAPEIGPGSYMKEKPKVKPLYKVKESAVFTKSKSVEKIKHSENPGPGPGYYPIDKYSSFNKKKIPNSLQNFGSSSSRFIEKRAVAKLGPGYYDSKTKVDNSKMIDSKIPFSSSDVRFQYKYNNIPGPGAYQDIDRIETQESKITLVHGPFGSTSMRFLSEKHTETPGPGQYKLESQKVLNKHPNAVFISKGKRDLISQNENPAPGFYEISSGIGKEKPQAISIIGRPKKNVVSNKNFGFKSSTNRFTKTKNQVPGPGHYEISRNNKSAGIITSKDRRFKDPTNRIPGPGTYIEDSDDLWNKKSYNVLFSEIL